MKSRSYNDFGITPIATFAGNRLQLSFIRQLLVYSELIYINTFYSQRVFPWSELILLFLQSFRKIKQYWHTQLQGLLLYFISWLFLLVFFSSSYIVFVKLSVADIFISSILICSCILFISVVIPGIKKQLCIVLQSLYRT